MNVNTLYVRNPKTRKWIQAVGKLADEFPCPHIFIDSDTQTVQVSTPSFNLRVKTVQDAKKLVTAYVTHRATDDELIARYSLD